MADFYLTQTGDEVQELLNTVDPTAQELASEIRDRDQADTNLQEQIDNLSADAYRKPQAGIPATDMTQSVQQSLEDANASIAVVGDKSYTPDAFSGLGRVNLEKNIQTIGGVEKNILTQDMFYKTEDGQRVPNTNTIFVIQYDYDLNDPNGENPITIPDGCVLKFDGGSLRNGKIVGNNTGIDAGLVKIFNTDVSISGTWNVAEAYPEMFGAKGDDVTDDTVAIQNCINVCKKIELNGNYKVSCTNETVNNSKIVFRVPSDRKIKVNGTITLTGNEERYGIFFVDATENIVIEGNGTIIGSNSDHQGSIEGAGIAIIIYGGKHILIKDIEICNQFTDCIYIRPGIGTHLGENAQDISIVNTRLHDARRQGISVVSGENIIIDGCIIKDIYGTAPGACIDVEREWENLPLAHILIKNVSGYDSTLGIVCAPPYPTEDVVMQNVSFYSTGSRNCESVIGDGIICRNCNFSLLSASGGCYQGSNIVYFIWRGSIKCVLSSCFLKHMRVESNSAGRVILSNCTLLYDENNLDSGMTIYDTSNGNTILDFYNSSIIVEGNYHYMNFGCVNMTKSYYYNKNEGITVKKSNIVDSVIVAGGNGALVRLSSSADEDAYITNTLLQSEDGLNTYGIRNQSGSHTVYCKNVTIIGFNYAKNSYKDGTVKEVNTTLIGNNDGTLSKAGIPKIGNSTVINTLAATLGIDDKGVQIYRTDQYGFGVWNGSKFILPEGCAYNVKRGGTTANRPVGSNIYVGFVYFDTSLSPAKPIYAKAISEDTVTWVDATGATV